MLPNLAQRTILQCGPNSSDWSGLQFRPCNHRVLCYESAVYFPNAMATKLVHSVNATTGPECMLISAWTEKIAVSDLRTSDLHKRIRWKDALFSNVISVQQFDSYRHSFCCCCWCFFLSTLSIGRSRITVGGGGATFGRHTTPDGCQILSQELDPPTPLRIGIMSWKFYGRKCEHRCIPMILGILTYHTTLKKFKKVSYFSWTWINYLCASRISTRASNQLNI